MKFDPMQIFFYLIRVIPVIVVIILVAYIFFSFKVEVHTELMERTNIEIAENILVSDLVVAKSVFDAKKLINLQSMEMDEKNKDEKYNIQPEPRICGYGYSVVILGEEEKYCEENSDCKIFCMNMCGLDEYEVVEDQHYDCKGKFMGFIGNRKCRCRCDPAKDDWQDKYVYQFGYDSSETEINTNQRQYPVGIYEDEFLGFHRSSVSPAVMTVMLYDTWLTRIACMAEMAYETRQVQRMNVYDFSKFGKGCTEATYRNPHHKCIGVKKFDEKNLCLFEPDYDNGWEFKKDECMQTDMPVETFYDGYKHKNYNNITLVALPIKSDVTSNPYGHDPNNANPINLERYTSSNCKFYRDDVAGKTDTVGMIILCIETEQGGNYEPV